MTLDWTIKSTLEWTQAHFETKDIESPRLTAQQLMAEATGLSRVELYTNYDQPLLSAQLATLREMIKRRCAGEPLQYILGSASFRRLELKMRPGVLIPRPETEVLVDVVLEALETIRNESHPLILDVCTGSGCIALSLLNENPTVRVVATDIDPVAIDLTRENAAMLGLNDDRLQILQTDLTHQLIADTGFHNSFSVVVSNPPYIPTSELEKLPIEIANYESELALDGGDDGLDIFRRIVTQAQTLLCPAGLLACELFETTLDAAKKICEAAGFTSVSIINDLAGRPRIISAYYGVVNPANGSGL